MMNTVYKECKKCHETKQLDEFSNYNKSKDKKTARCRSCRLEDKKAYRLRNREQINEKQNTRYANDEHHRERQKLKASQYYKEHHDVEIEKRRDWWKRNGQFDNAKKARLYREDLHYRCCKLFNSIKNRAKRKGLECTITVEDIMEHMKLGICEITGVAFQLNVDSDEFHFHPHSPSIDRIDTTKGYTPDNIQAVTHQYNVAKGQWGHDMLLELAANLLKGKRTSMPKKPDLIIETGPDSVIPNPTIKVSLSDVVKLHENEMNGCKCDWTYEFIANLFGVEVGDVYEMCNEVKDREIQC